VLLGVIANPASVAETKQRMLLLSNFSPNQGGVK
jgi:hypothetical protein